jgi:ABC-type bacteriocin/lantibiotic exporter with double-glycine peptidase domain
MGQTVGSNQEPEATKLLGTTMHGTSVGQIVMGMESVGFTCRKVVIASDRLADIKPPAVLMVDHPALGPESHAVALVRVEENAFEVWDPLIGSEIMTADKLGSIWRGRAVEISRAGE